MPRICVVLIAGLDDALLKKSGGLTTLNSLKHRATYQPAFPAVTCSVQATLTTGVLPDRHGIICNGLYTHHNTELQKHLDLSNHAESRRQVSFWEQGNSLLQTPRFWQAPGFPKKKVSMLFWQNSMGGTADIVITPKPTHTADGKTLTACWSDPPDLYAILLAKLGPFPLHNYWSPMAGLPSSQWIARAAEFVWREHQPDLQLVYIPHLDFNLMRGGPNSPAIPKDLLDVDALLAPLAAQVRADGGTLVVLGDYGMYEVQTPIMPNLALRQAGLLKTRADADGKLLVDYDASQAFVMADHQAAFLYGEPAATAKAVELLGVLPGVDRIVTDVGLLQLASRAGQAVLIAAPTAWFAHDWWESDEEKPRWQFSVDIHNKPGFDPRELFFDPMKKCIAQNAALVKGSHGRIDDSSRWPVLLSDTPIPTTLSAVGIAGLFSSLLAV
ncbi:MAG TPA: alkaline phosphatase family protein [Phycisphaerae bacterium]|jgi:hypothetical protein